MPNDISYEAAHKARKGPKVSMGKGMHEVQPGDPGTGKYSDRIKIEPKFTAEPQGPLPKDTEIQKILRSQETKI